jgi:HD superfamily phosphohydrolase
MANCQPLEELDPRQIAWLIRRPSGSPDDQEGHPDWLKKLRALFSGIYTVDNMDFVLRDAYMSGYNTKAFDISRLIHYTFFTENGLTIHSRGLPTLINFIETRANLFRTIYFHRTVRGIDIALEEYFSETMKRLFPGNPLQHLKAYQGLTETSFLVDVVRWADSSDPTLRELGSHWKAIINRKEMWRMACERTMHFHGGQAESTTIFSEPGLVERRVRESLPKPLREIPLRIDVARHYHRLAPESRRASRTTGTTRPADSRMNWMMTSCSGACRPALSSSAFTAAITVTIANSTLHFRKSPADPVEIRRPICDVARGE